MPNSPSFGPGTDIVNGTRVVFEKLITSDDQVSYQFLKNECPQCGDKEWGDFTREEFPPPPAKYTCCLACKRNIKGMPTKYKKD